MEIKRFRNAKEYHRKTIEEFIRLLGSPGQNTKVYLKFSTKELNLLDDYAWLLDDLDRHVKEYEKITENAKGNGWVPDPLPDIEAIRNGYKSQMTKIYRRGVYRGAELARDFGYGGRKTSAIESMLTEEEAKA